MFTNKKKIFFLCFSSSEKKCRPWILLVVKKALCLELPNVILRLIHEYMDIDGVVYRTYKAPPNSLIGVIDDHVFYEVKGKAFMDGEDMGLELVTMLMYRVDKVYRDWIAFTSCLDCYLWNRNTRETILLPEGCGHHVNHDSIYYISLPDSLYRYDISTRIRIKVADSVRRLSSIGDSLTLCRKTGSSLLDGPILWQYRCTTL